MWPSSRSVFRFSCAWGCIGRLFAFSATRPCLPLPLRSRSAVCYCGILGAALGLSALSWSVVTIYSCLALLYVAGSRFVVRYYLLTRHVQPTVARVAIYGAGEAGARLSTVLSTTRAFDPLVFIDDNRSLHGRMVNGIKVFPPEQLPELIKDRRLDRILLALPSLTRRRRREILSLLEPLGVHVQTVPEFEQLVTGDANVGDIREVDVGDLLGRDSVPPKAGLFEACIRDRVVMVTGAGGSIGSELCRQIIGLGPKRLILFEMSELALYNIERELRTIRRTKFAARGDDRAHRQRASQAAHARDIPGLPRSDCVPRGGLQACADRRTERDRGHL